MIATNRFSPGQVATVLVAASLACGASARAENLLNSNEKPPSSSPTSPQSVEGKNEFTFVPAVGGSTDIGVAAGYFTAVTRNKKGYVPYLWNVESAGLVSFGTKNGSANLTFIDAYAMVTVPRLLEYPIDLDIRPSFTDERTLYYYGMGNASRASPPSGQSSTYFQYARVHPSIMADIRFKLRDHVAGLTGLRYTGSWLDVPAGSKLRQDMQNGSSEVRGLIGPTAPS
jgi:hypothetical protein